MASEIQTGLVLQGGGALGAYELGVVKRLYEEPWFRPAIISGVSIGAITAAVLVGAKAEPIATLEALWERFTTLAWPTIPEPVQPFLALFGNPSFYRLRSDYLMAPFWTSYYDTAPLRTTLAEFIDFEQINRVD